jgi:hypothetical protein
MEAKTVRSAHDCGFGQGHPEEALSGAEGPRKDLCIRPHTSPRAAAHQLRRYLHRTGGIFSIAIRYIFFHSPGNSSKTLPPTMIRVLAPVSRTAPIKCRKFARCMVVVQDTPSTCTFNRRTRSRRLEVGVFAPR